MKQSILWALLGTGFTFLMTSLGAALVFFFRGSVRPGVQRIFLGFAAGVMIAASVWSLLVPAIEAAEEAGQIGWLPAAGGFLLGVGFLLLMDRLLPHLHPGSSAPEGSSSSWKRTTLLVLAVTLHNIPEGMAVGLSFALASQQLALGNETVLYTSALVLALGIGLQNFPEGTAISLPLARLPVWQPIRYRGAGFRGAGCPDRRKYPAVNALAPLLCRRFYDVRCGGGTHSGGSPGRAFQFRHSRRYGRLSGDDDPGCCPGLTAKILSYNQNHWQT